ncbi:hypothetical protein GCM10010174_87260 [Kutzneria viridogrisea]|uniref:Uncharacterized protein n=2 Tax=Kutzneria TaxID=43356 RepID=W5WUH1_9PSEU|nr:YbaB/EbfC family nucleoid-associated protein [Kutzneria albida]AHI01800.1 hypothetical protein KALB_8443 [Kutzneria albida DSM 43870]MBA8931763.1 DNA-binding protein YbaB [Kutzneria viridogrisea]
MTDPEQVAALLAANAATLESMRVLLANSQQQLAEVTRLTQELGERTAHAQSPDRMVTVTVDGTGALRQVSFDRDTFEHHTPMSLASAVTKAARDAVRQLTSNDDAELERVSVAATHEPSSTATAQQIVAPAPQPPTPTSSTAVDLDQPVAVSAQADEQRTVVTAPPPALSDDPVPVPAPVAIQDPPPRPVDVVPDSGNSQIDHVVSALSRLPSYTGIVTRVLGVRDPERAAAIASQYVPGETIIERTFLSTSANPAYTGDGLVRYTIEAKHNGKLIGGISQDGEAFGEVVFGPGCRFRITGKRYYPSMRGWDIALEELG